VESWACRPVYQNYRWHWTVTDDRPPLGALQSDSSTIKAAARPCSLQGDNKTARFHIARWQRSSGAPADRIGADGRVTRCCAIDHLSPPATPLLPSDRAYRASMPLAQLRTACQLTQLAALGESGRDLTKRYRPQRSGSGRRSLLNHLRPCFGVALAAAALFAGCNLAIAGGF
jgi:hypothetical protein